MLSRPSRLNQSGFDHAIVAVLCVVVCGIIGTWLVVAGRAATVQWKGVLEEGSGTSGYCLSANGSSNGSKVVLNACSKTANNAQVWNLEDVKTATVMGVSNVQEFELQNAGGNNKCLNDPYGSRIAGTAMQLYACNSADVNSLWVWGSGFSGKGLSARQLISLGSVSGGKGLCLDDAYGATAANTKVQGWTCKTPAQANQSWFEASSSSAGVSANAGLSFDDEFTGAAGSAPNSTRWTHDVGSTSDGWGNNELEYYTGGSANSYLDGQGHLVIEAEKYTGSTYKCWYGACKYTSARLQTMHTFSQAYGHFEARIELQNMETGLWPAFWLLDENAASRGEIDIFENYGSAFIEGSLHGDAPSLDTSDDFATTNDNPEGWHTYAIDWSPTVISFSIDGKVYATHTKSGLSSDWAFTQPYYILLNLAVGGSGTNGKTPGTLPGKMLVDYVRVSK